MQTYQRCNHFPGMFNLAKKNQLSLNLERMKKWETKEYSFYPKTWVLPGDFKELKQFYNKCNDEDSDGPGNKTFIVKPEGSCQGRGIFLTWDLESISNQDHMVV